MEQTKINLTNCDQEPVSFIGSIQDFGCLVAFDKKSHQLTHQSQNTSTFLSDLPPGINEKDFQSLMSQSQLPLRCFESDTHCFYEISPKEIRDESLDRNLLKSLDRIQGASGKEDLWDCIAESFASITKMDRVMVYHFHEDLHGEVVSERVTVAIESFLGLHYPASDIPAPARAVFQQSWVRVIPDVNGKTHPLVPGNVHSLDLSKSQLRAVSPVHLKYLRNMKVASSLTVSLIVEGKLWGLVACHHHSPMNYSAQLREAAEVLGRFASSELENQIRRDETLHRQRLEGIHQELISHIQTASDMALAITQHTPNLLDLIDSSGAAAALYTERRWITVGSVPETEKLDSIVNWLSEKYSDQIVFSTEKLSSFYPPAKEFTDLASGLLAVSLPKAPQNYILWFRPEIIQTVTWAGNPEEKNAGLDGHINPRKSFDAWKETVRGTSAVWKAWEKAAALELRNSLIALDLRRQFEKEQQARAVAEKAVQAREELISIVSHDLKNPLNSMMINSALIQRQTEGDEKVANLVNRNLRMVKVMSNLIDDILNLNKIENGKLELNLIKQSVEATLDEALEILKPIAEEKGIALEKIVKGNCQATFDKNRILQVFSNIIGNAIKFTPGKGLIKICCHGESDSILIEISDTGPGIPPEHLTLIFDRYWQAKNMSRMGSGLGLAISKGIILGHGGEIWAESDGSSGSRFFFRLPI